MPSSKRQKFSADLSAKSADLKSREKKLEEKLDHSKLPRHLAIIMDGNGRWAKQRGWVDRIRGHEAGIKSVRLACENCAELGMEALTLYAFSRENWQRPRHETTALMALLRRFLVTERATMMKNKIRLIASGTLSDLPSGARKSLQKTINLTAANDGMVLNLALSYSGREEIVRAARRLAAKVERGKLKAKEIDEDLISAHLYSPKIGDPDLLIRTSGECRVSNFLLWQIAYSEIYITPTLWPDFRREHLLEALVDYQRRERRYGRVAPKAP